MWQLGRRALFTDYQMKRPAEACEYRSPAVVEHWTLHLNQERGS